MVHIMNKDKLKQRPSRSKSMNNGEYHFKCAGCGNWSISTTTPEKREKEYEELYGEQYSDEERVLVCNTCFIIVQEKRYE